MKGRKINFIFEKIFTSIRYQINCYDQPQYEMISGYTPHSLLGPAGGASVPLTLEHSVSSNYSLPRAGASHNSSSLTGPSGIPQVRLPSSVPDIVASGQPLPPQPPSYSLASKPLYTSSPHPQGETSQSDAAGPSQVHQTNRIPAEGGAFSNSAFTDDAEYDDDDDDNESFEI